MRVVRGADAESFAQKYRLHCPAGKIIIHLTHLLY